MDVASAVIGGLIGAVLAGGSAFVAFNSRLVKIETALQNAINEMGKMEARFDKSLEAAETRWREFLDHSFDQWQGVVNTLLRDMPEAIGKAIRDSK